MIQNASSTPAQPPLTFEDRLGKRFEAVSPEGDPVEVLELKEEFANAPSFEFALRKRVNTLTAFREPSFAAPRGVRLGGTLAVVADRIRGTRLSTVLDAFERDLVPLEFNATVCILRQLVPALAILHERMPELCHGALAPERIVITPEGRVVIVEHVLASALEALHYSDQRYWEELRIAVPKTAGPPCFDQRSDVLQIGLLALTLIHGRSLNTEEYPVPTASLAERAWAVSASGGLEPLPASMRTWLNRVLQLEPKHAFNTATAVWSDLKTALPLNSAAELQALTGALARYGFDALPPLPAARRTVANGAAPGPAPSANPMTPPPLARPATPIPAAPMAPTTLARPTTPVPSAQPITPIPRPATSTPLTPVPVSKPITPIPLARPAAAAALAQPLTPIPSAQPATPSRVAPPIPPTPTPARLAVPPLVTPTPIRTPAPAQTPVRTPLSTPAPAAMQYSAVPPAVGATPAKPVYVPAAVPTPVKPAVAPTPAKPIYAPAAVASATPSPDSGQVARFGGAGVLDVADVQSEAVQKGNERLLKAGPDATTIITTRPPKSGPLVSLTSADPQVSNSMVRSLGAAAAFDPMAATRVEKESTPGLEPEPAPRFPIQDEPDDEELTLSTPWWRRRSVAAAVFVMLAAGVGVAGRSLFSPSADAAAPGTLVVETNPPGVAVVLDGKRAGQTPVRLEVAAGAHVLTLLTEGDPRTIPLNITAGGTVSQYVDMPKPVAQTGQLQIQTQPSGARVIVDGTPRGTAPLTVDGLSPGSHSVEVSNDGGSVRQEITVAAGATASLVVPMTAAAPQGAISGYISVSAPDDVQIYEDTRLVGSSRSDRLMVPVGRHEFDIVNEPLGYRTRRVVTVTAGQVVPIRIDWPNGSMAINAQPWAEVFIDGERVGETPIGNVPVPIGTHEVRFRHPELGEQVVRSTVTLGGPARISVDLRKR